MTQSSGVQSLEDAEALILGLGLFATGGGGTAERGRRWLGELLEDGFEVSWVPVDQVDPDLLICSAYGMGSIAPTRPMSAQERAAIGIEGVPFPRPWLRAVEELEAHLGRSIGGLAPFELGPSNSLVAVDAAARTGRILIDGDFIGRALPKMSQTLPSVAGRPTWPIAIADPWGNCLILKDCPSNELAERLGKQISRVTKSVDFAASCSHAGFPLSVQDALPYLIPGTLSRSQGVGRAVLAARAEGRDPVETAIEAIGGVRLFDGTVAHREWEDTADGYMRGTTTVEGSGSFEGSSVDIWFLNEHHIVRDGSRVIATSPDIITIVERETAEPLSNTEITVGMEVSILGFRIHPSYRSPESVAVNGPRYYGFDFDYVPIEELHPNGLWQ